jgi:glycosyltransferase involved in cell wall biosynthesis
MPPSPGELVAAHLQRREYDAALEVALSLPASHPERYALERVAHARAARFGEAARAGRCHLARSGASTEDYFRQAQILLRCDLPDEGFAVGMEALRRSPEDWRLLVPVIEAVLAEPRLESELRREAAPIIARYPSVRPQRQGQRGGVLVTNHLPHFASLIGDHPIERRICDMIEPIPRYRPDGYGTGLLATALAELDRAKAAVDRLLSADLGVGRSHAARYVGSRAPVLLVDDGGCSVEFLLIGMTLGERPYFIIFDVFHTLFYPFRPDEHMRMPEDDPELFRIIRHELRSPACLGILPHYEAAIPMLAALFDDPTLPAKCHHLPIPSTIEPVAHIRREPRPVDPGTSVTLLFTASFRAIESGFYMRGGVDVLNAFLALAETHPQLRLILCGPLPGNLAPRLVQAIEAHPAVEWHPGFVPTAEYEAIYQRSDIFVMPSVTVFRNGLVRAMAHGVVPVVSDCYYAEEFVTDGVNGLVVPGRRHMADVAPEGGRFRTDWRALYAATNEPADPMFHAAFVDALRRLINDRDLRSAMSQRVQADADRHECSPAHADSLRNLVQQHLPQ